MAHPSGVPLTGGARASSCGTSGGDAANRAGADPECTRLYLNRHNGSVAERGQFYFEKSRKKIGDGDAGKNWARKWSRDEEK